MDLDALQRTAHDSYNFSVLYQPGDKPVHNRFEDELDRERVLLVDTFRKIEQGTGQPQLYALPSADLSVAALPAAFVVAGKGFGTVETQVFIQVGASATLVAANAGITDTAATFNISGLTLTAGQWVTVRIIKKDATYPAIKWAYSNPMQAKTVA